MSDLGNQDRPNSMKLGGDIDLDKLLLNPVVFVFVLSSFPFFREGGCFFDLHLCQEMQVNEIQSTL